MVDDVVNEFQENGFNAYGIGVNNDDISDKKVCVQPQACGISLDCTLQTNDANMCIFNNSIHTHCHLYR